jgi:DUF971 family protein
MSNPTARPSAILLHSVSNRLELQFEDLPPIVLSAEYLRINSPSAEVQGHSAAERILVAGKADVAIRAVHPVGNYAILLVFSDEHQTGIYTFAYLQTLAAQFETRFAAYEEELRVAGKSRFAATVQ